MEPLISEAFLAPLRLVAPIPGQVRVSPTPREDILVNCRCSGYILVILILTALC